MTRMLTGGYGRSGWILRDAVMPGAADFNSGVRVRLGRGLSTGWMH